MSKKQQNSTFSKSFIIQKQYEESFWKFDKARLSFKLDLYEQLLQKYLNLSDIYQISDINISIYLKVNRK